MIDPGGFIPHSIQTQTASRRSGRNVPPRLAVFFLLPLLFNLPSRQSQTLRPGFVLTLLTQTDIIRKCHSYFEYDSAAGLAAMGNHHSRQAERTVTDCNENTVSGCSAAGSAPALGAGCRRFESCHSDQEKLSAQAESFLLKKSFIEQAQPRAGRSIKLRPVCFNFPYLIPYFRTGLIYFQNRLQSW